MDQLFIMFLMPIDSHILLRHENGNWLVRREREWKEGNVSFHDALNTFYLRLYGVEHRTTQIVREKTHCRHMDYSFLLTAMVLLYAPSHRQDIPRHLLNQSWSTMKDRSDDPSHHGATSRSRHDGFVTFWSDTAIV